MVKITIDGTITIQKTTTGNAPSTQSTPTGVAIRTDGTITTQKVAKSEILPKKTPQPL